MDGLQRIAGSAGCERLDSAGGAVSNKNWWAFIPDQDTVLGVLSGKDATGATENFLVTMALTGKTLKAGILYVVPANAKITTVTVTSGAIIGYKRPN